MPPKCSLQIHDSILVEAPAKDAEKIGQYPKRNHGKYIH
jgi:hypothetical protein